MRLKDAELEELHVESKLRVWQRECDTGVTTADTPHISRGRGGGSSGAGRGSGGSRGGGGSSGISGGGIGASDVFSLIGQPGRGKEPEMPGIKVSRGAMDDIATRLLTDLQVNEFFRFAARRASERHLSLAGEKMIQILTAFRRSEYEAETAAARAASLEERLTTELALLRRKADSLQNNLFVEEEAKRKALVKYLHTTVNSVSSTRGRNNRNNRSSRSRQQHGGSDFTSSKEYREDGDGDGDGDSYGYGGDGNDDDDGDDDGGGGGGEAFAPETTVVRLAENGVGDEEVHALVAVLTGADNVESLDLQSNGITVLGCRALAPLLRVSKALREIDLRDNRLDRPAVRILVEALGHNPRVQHVFVHEGTSKSL